MALTCELGDNDQKLTVWGEIIAERLFTCPECSETELHVFFIKLDFTECQCKKCTFLGFWNWKQRKLYDSRTKQALDPRFFMEKN